MVKFGLGGSKMVKFGLGGQKWSNLVWGVQNGQIWPGGLKMVKFIEKI